MRKFSKKQYLVAGAAAVIVAAGTGAAYAYWTTSGTGHGAGSVGAATQWTVSVGTTTGGPLTPGGDTQTLHFTITNPDSGHAGLTNVAVSVPVFSDRANTSLPACTESDFTISNISITDGTTPTSDPGSTLAGSPLYDVAGHGVITGTATLSLVDGSGNQNNCQNLQPTVQVDAS